LDEIAQFWEAERNGADEEFTMSSDVVAVDGDAAVVRVWRPVRRLRGRAMA
jgi:hypothetical protein